MVNITPDMAREYAKWGRPGDPIKGSVLVRDFCCCCGTAIRVSPRNKLGRNECEKCEGCTPQKVIEQQRARRTDFRPAIQGRQ